MRLMLAAVVMAAAIQTVSAGAGERKIIRIATDNTNLVLEVGPNKPGIKPRLVQYGKIYAGDFLMKVGLNVCTTARNTSTVVELPAQD